MGTGRPSESGYSMRSAMTEALNRGGVWPPILITGIKFVGLNQQGTEVYKISMRQGQGGSRTVRTQAWNGNHFSAPGKLRGSPSRPDTGGGSGGGGGPTQGQKEAAALNHARERWALNITNSTTLSPGRKEWLRDQLKAYDGDAAGLNSMMDELFNKSIALEGTLPDGGDQGDTGFDWNDYLGGGGGGGGGFAGPQYVAPDERVVEDQVKGALVSLLGNIPDDDMVARFTQIYMTDHRRNFDTEEREIDPAQSVREAIRNTDNYKAIHELRPESTDERQWVAERRQAAAQGGLDTGQQEDFAITQATVGGDVQDVQDAAAVRQTKRSGTTRGTSMEQRMRQTARKMMTGVIR